MKNLEFDICDNNCCHFDIYDNNQESFKMLICFDSNKEQPYNVQISKEQDYADTIFEQEFKNMFKNLIL